MVNNGPQPENREGRRPRFDREEVMMRKFIRPFTSQPTQAMPMPGDLDPELWDFKHKAAENYKLYKEHYANTGEYGVKLIPVFITKDEREFYTNIENQTKKDIIALVVSLAEMMPDKEESTRYIAQVKKDEKKILHADCVALYYSTIQKLEDMVAQSIVEGMEGEEVEEEEEEDEGSSEGEE